MFHFRIARLRTRVEDGEVCHLGSLCKSNAPIDTQQQSGVIALQEEKGELLRRTQEERMKREVRLDRVGSWC